MKKKLTHHKKINSRKGCSIPAEHAHPVHRTSVLRVLCLPTRLIVDSFHFILPNDKKTGHAVVGTVIMIVGGGLEIGVHHVPEIFIVKAVATSLAGVVHAFGAAPLIKHLADRFGIEV